MAQKLLAADQSNVLARAMLGVADLYTHDVPGAIRELRKNIEIAPQRLDSYTSLAAIYLSTSRPAEAESVMRKAVQANPQSAPAHMALGKFQFTIGKLAMAEEEYQGGGRPGPKGYIASIIFGAGVPGNRAKGGC